MERRQSISLFHIDLFSGDSGSNLWQVPNTVAAVRTRREFVSKKKRKRRKACINKKRDKRRNE